MAFDIYRLVDEVVDLPRDGLMADAKEGTLPRRQKVDWPRLEGIGWIVDLLGHIKTLVDHNVAVARLLARERPW